jgi:nitroreductase
MALNDPNHFVALEKRYASQSKPKSIEWNDTIATLLAHRSVRAYLPDALPDTVIETLIAAAQSASTSSNLNLWSVVAVTDKAVKAQLAVLANNQRHIDEAPLILLWVADLARTRALGEREQAPTEALDYLESFVTATVDASLAAQNAVIAAESLGLGTVYIGALRNRPEDVAELVGLPSHAVVVFGLVVGRPDPDRPAAVKPRPVQQVVLHKGQYSQDKDADTLREYDDVSRIFQEDQGLPANGWIEVVLARTAAPASLNGRDRLRQALLNRGFQLI